MKVKITLAQFYPKLGNIGYNLKRHLEIIQQSRSKTQLLIFPELSLTGYNLMDLTLEVAQEKDSPLLEPFLEASKDMGIILGLVELGDDALTHNSSFYYYDGRLEYIHRKRYSLPRAIDTPWGKIGLVICEETLDPIVPFLLVQKGIKIIIVLSNSPSYGFDTGTGIPRNASMWHALTSIYSRLYSCYIVYVNRVGFEDGLNFWGGSHIVDPRGEVIAQCPYFEEAVIDAELDLDLIPVTRFIGCYPGEEGFRDVRQITI